MSVLYLTEAEVGRVLTMDLALDAVSSAFRKLALEEAENVPRQRCQTDLVMLHVLPAAAKTLGVIGFKAYTTSKQGAQFHVTLYDAKSGRDDRDSSRPICSASTAPGRRAASRRRSSPVPMPRPSAASAPASRPARNFSRCARCGRSRGFTSTAATPSAAKAFAAQMTSETGVEVIAGREARGRGAGDSTSSSPRRTRASRCCSGEWVGEGQHLNLIGSNFLAKTEVDVEVFRRATLTVVDSKEQAKLEAGDFVAGARRRRTALGRRAGTRAAARRALPRPRSRRRT